VSSFLINGDVGQLEVIVDEPKKLEDQSPAYIAVVCHPHPLFQGTMHNKVAYMLARAFVAAGIPSLRFNFRGVGKSEGEHADGIGEIGDALAAMTYLKEQYPNTPMLLAGFSFGSFVSLGVVNRPDVIEHFALQGLVTVAPPVGRWDFTNFKALGIPYLIVQGDSDELVDAEVVKNWTESLDPKPQFKMIPEADHFFHGKLTLLKQEVLNWLDSINVG